MSTLNSACFYSQQKKGYIMFVYFVMHPCSCGLVMLRGQKWSLDPNGANYLSYMCIIVHPPYLTLFMQHQSINEQINYGFTRAIMHS